MKNLLFAFMLFLFPLGLAADQEKVSWEKTEALWNFGIISSCDRGLDPDPIRFFQTDSCNLDVYRNISKGEIVWIRCRFLPYFYKLIFPSIKEPFVLVISDGDESFPSDIQNQMDIEKFIQDERVIHIFAQNCDYKGTSIKVSHLPIGMDFHSIAYKGGYWGEKGSPKQQEKQLKELLTTFAPTKERKKRAYVDFQLNDTMRCNHRRYLQFGEDRATIFNRLKETKLIDYPDGKLKRSDLWQAKGKYAFSVSPHGNGLDCHRTWEDLMLGCIVIVKTSPLDPLYKDLPVVIVKDWSEVTEENLNKWLKQYGDAFTNPLYREKLTTQYWMNRIRNYTLPYKEREIR